MPSGYSLFKNCSFDSTRNKLDCLEKKKKKNNRTGNKNKKKKKKRNDTTN